METQELEKRITYIGSDGKAFWHGKLSTLKKTFKFVRVLKVEPITQSLYGDAKK